MRHGTTVWNERGITQGRTNNRLSKNGVLLTEKVSKRYKDCKFDIIFCSPLMRTMQTANIMNRHHNVKIIKDNNLIEIDQGIFTGRNKEDLSKDEKRLKALRDESTGMETYASALDRARAFLSALRKNTKYKNVLVITHNVIASFLDDILNNVKVDFKNPDHLGHFKNAEIKTFEIKES